MKYTQQQLESMSDGEINAIATHIYDNLDETWEVDEEVIINNPHSQRNWLHYDVKPFCNSWSDCGSLIDEGQISLIKDERVGYYANTGWLHHSDAVLDSMFESYHNNPKRAVTIVYILDKQGKNNEQIKSTS